MSLLVAILFAGGVSYSTIPIEMDPDVAVPVIWVLLAACGTRWAGEGESVGYRVHWAGRALVMGVGH